MTGKCHYFREKYNQENLLSHLACVSMHAILPFVMYNFETQYLPL